MNRPSKNQQLSAISLALMLMVCAESAQAKKDLFANDPAANPANQQQLVTTPTTSEKPAEKKAEEQSSQAATPENVEPKNEKQSYLTSQLKRLQLNIVQTKDKLLGKNDQPKSLTADTHTQASTAHLENAAEPASSHDQSFISSAEAAQRAQKIAEGKVMNVKKYEEDNRTIYAVKLLQKNGRMKTVNLDAITGQEIDEPAQQAE